MKEKKMQETAWFCFKWVLKSLPCAQVAPSNPGLQWHRKSPTKSSQRIVFEGLQGLGIHWLGSVKHIFFVKIHLYKFFCSMAGYEKECYSIVVIVIRALRHILIMLVKFQSKLICDYIMRRETKQIWKMFTKLYQKLWRLIK